LQISFRRKKEREEAREGATAEPTVFYVFDHASREKKAGGKKKKKKKKEDKSPIRSANCAHISLPLRLHGEKSRGKRGKKGKEIRAPTQKKEGKRSKTTIARSISPFCRLTGGKKKRGRNNSRWVGEATSELFS